MRTAVVFDSAGTLLNTYRTAKDVVNAKLLFGVETTTLTCSVKGRALVVLYAGSQEFLEADADMLISDYIQENNTEFGISCSSGTVTCAEVEEILLNDKNARMGDLQVCIRSVKEECANLPAAVNSGVIVNRNSGRIDYTITTGGRPFAKAKETISALFEMGADVYIASGDRTDKLVLAADFLGIPHENVHGVSTPPIKAEIVRNLKSDHDCVIMVGDGVNDIAAMKEADLSILTKQQESRKPKMLIEAADCTISDIAQAAEIIEKYISEGDAGL